MTDLLYTKIVVDNKEVVVFPSERHQPFGSALDSRPLNLTTFSTINQPGTFYCSQNSIAVGEHLFGTATTASAWLLIEYPGLWNAKAFNESSIPSRVKDSLSSWIGSNPQARVQLIRNSESATRSKISVYFALPGQDPPHIYYWLLDRYDDLLDIDLETPLAEESDTGTSHTNPLFLVCTNGRRDRCCSKFGRPVYESLSTLFPEDTWETTHLGGHRFAANLLCFPHGILYGRVTPTETSEIARRHRSGLLLLEKYRGRVTLPEPAQAAEFYLREKLQEQKIESISFQHLNQPADLDWQVSFLSNETRHSYRVLLRQDPSGVETVMNCKDEKGQLVNQYYLEGIENLS